MFCFSLLSAAGCTFDEDSDPSLCEFSQGEEDDFDWQLFRNHASPHSTSDLLRGKSEIIPLAWMYSLCVVTCK
uniref:MAM domain-containing protein n=1 Tax=Sinocyclocheilus anshuiensis TaxID=1608454 RepID=A0A671MGL7_9TELE